MEAKRYFLNKKFKNFTEKIKIGIKMFISIITASYNYEKYIKETIESVINQTYKNWELIIVDDGSTDNSVEIIKSYCQKDNRIKLYQHEGGVNKGLSETIKLGISKANGDWIAFLESDDKFMPECLEEKVKVIEKNPEVKFIFSDLQMFGDEKEKTDKEKWYNKFKKRYKTIYMDLSLALLKQNWICTFSIVMLRKDLITDCDYNTPIDAFLDLWLWVQISQKTKFYYLDKKLTFWRTHLDSFINKPHDDKIEFFENSIEKFYKKNNIRVLAIIFIRRLKRIRKHFFKLKFGKNAYLIIMGKVIYKSTKI